MSISVIIVTRGRPDSLEATIESAFSTAKTNNVEFIVYVDDDDQETIERCELLTYPKLKVFKGPRPHIIAEAYNVVYEHCSNDIIMVCCDDIRFMTVGWDQLVIDKFDKIDDKIGIVYGNDLVKGEKMATLPFMHRNWIDIVGYILPPYFIRENGDTWLTEVSNMINRRIYIPDMIIKHACDDIHSSSKHDKTNKERRALDKAHPVPGGRWEYYKQLAPQREDAASKLKHYMIHF